MVTQQGRISDPNDLWSERPEGRGSRGGGTLLMAALLGVGIGLLAAPQPGTRTRKLLLDRLSALGEDVGEGLEEVQEVGSKARKRVKQRLAKLRSEAEDEEAPEPWLRARRSSRGDEMSEDDEGSGAFGKLFMLAAGLAATYFMTSERTAPARTRVQETASDVGRRANDQWDRFQRGGIRGWREGNEIRSETRTASNPSDEAPQGS